MVARYRGRIIVAVLCLVLAKIAVFSVPLVLKHIVDALIPSSGTVAVVEGSGAGQPTPARLLLPVYDVDAGNISAEGQHIRSVSAKSLHQANGVVPREALLCNDTIAPDIGDGRNDKRRVRSVVADGATQHAHRETAHPHTCAPRSSHLGTACALQCKAANLPLVQRHPCSCVE